MFNKFHTQHGFGLIGVLIIVGIISIGVIALYFSQPVSNTASPLATPSPSPVTEKQDQRIIIQPSKMEHISFPIEIPEYPGHSVVRKFIGSYESKYKVTRYVYTPQTNTQAQVNLFFLENLPLNNWRITAQNAANCSNESTNCLSWKTLEAEKEIYALQIRMVYSQHYTIDLIEKTAQEYILPISSTFPEILLSKISDISAVYVNKNNSKFNYLIEQSQPLTYDPTIAEGIKELWGEQNFDGTMGSSLFASDYGFTRFPKASEDQKSTLRITNNNLQYIPHPTSLIEFSYPIQE